MFFDWFFEFSAFDVGKLKTWRIQKIFLSSYVDCVKKILNPRILFWFFNFCPPASTTNITWHPHRTILQNKIELNFLTTIMAPPRSKAPSKALWQKHCQSSDGTSSKHSGSAKRDRHLAAVVSRPSDTAAIAVPNNPPPLLLLLPSLQIILQLFPILLLSAFHRLPVMMMFCSLKKRQWRRCQSSPWCFNIFKKMLQTPTLFPAATNRWWQWQPLFSKVKILFLTKQGKPTKTKSKNLAEIPWSM